MLQAPQCLLVAACCWCAVAAEPGSAPDAPHGGGIVTAEQAFEVLGQSTEDEDADIARVGSEDEVKSDLVDEWDKHMEGYVPELLLTFPLPARTDEFFFEDLSKESLPVLVRGGFFASASDATSEVAFSITDPGGNTIFDKPSEAEGLFHFVAKQPGIYTFIVSNHRWMEEKMVTFTVGKGNQTHLQEGHMRTVEDTAKAIDKSLVDIQTESTYLWIRQSAHMKTVESIHARVLSFCVVEFLVLVGISGFQVYFIKGLLSDRRVL